MRSGMIRPPGVSYLILLRMSSVGAAYPDIVRQTSGEVSGIGGAGTGRIWREGGAHGGYGA